jgi:hypothetical protein
MILQCPQCQSSIVIEGAPPQRPGSLQVQSAAQLGGAGSDQSNQLAQRDECAGLQMVNETVDWEACVRFVDPEGNPAEGLRVILTPEP